MAVSLICHNILIFILKKIIKITQLIQKKILIIEYQLNGALKMISDWMISLLQNLNHGLIHI